jgi:DNA excision repair protein ERCC-4
VVVVVVERVRVYADVREEASGIPSMLESMGVIVLREQLPVGDYVLPGEVVVERKSVDDYASSLFDGRLFDQVSRMADVYDVIVLVVEGSISELYRYQDRFKHLYSALASLISGFNVSVIHTIGPSETAMLIESLARKALESRGSRVVIHRKPRLEGLREWQLYVVSSLPGIGPKMAERLLESFKTVEAICTASIAELQRVVGGRRAERIKEILKTPYEPPGRKPRTLKDYVG